MAKLLTNKRERWGRERNTQIFQGKVLAPPIPAQQRYKQSIESKIVLMTEEYAKQIERYFKANPELTQDWKPKPIRQTLNELRKKWAAVFSELSQVAVPRMMSQVDNFSKALLTESLKEMSGGLTIKPPSMTRALRSRMSASAAENVGLIKSIPDTFHQKISGIVFRSIQSGGKGTQQIFDQINNLNQVTRNRAELIAVDQTRKIAASLNSERMKSVGVKQFEWIHSGGGAEPRELHVEYDGQIFDMDNPPIIDKRTGERGLPGQLINCKCKMRPIVDFTQYLENDQT